MDMWDEVTIENVKLKNRIVRSATNEHLGTLEGEITDDYIQVYKNLAKNGVGLLITSHMAVDRTQRADSTHICVNEDYNKEKLKILASKVHTYGAKIMVQISSGGYRAKNVPGQIAKSPSDRDDSIAMTEGDIEECIKNYAKAVRIIKEAGFDGVQIHLAHSYLLSEFLDPFYNERKDEFGGSVENRYRIIHKIMLAIQKMKAPDFLITVKIDTTSKEGKENFLQDQIQVCKWLERDGVDAIEISGSNWKEFKQEKPYFLENALKIKKEVKVPIILVGGFRNVKQIQNAIGEGIDLISMSRPFIVDENFIEKLKSNEESECINCNKCFEIYRTEHKRCIWRKDVIHQLEINFPNR